MRRALAIGLLVLAMACGRDTISRAQWEHMSQHDRVLYVSSLIGGEKAKDAKGGGGRETSHPAEDYVKQIDEAYARGDQRTVPEIFAELPR
jgi:hypothetical protein